MRTKKNIFLTLIIVIFSNISFADEKSTASDILFLKIQELEIEIAELRNKIESQNHLIEKLISENSSPINFSSITNSLFCSIRERQYSMASVCEDK